MSQYEMDLKKDPSSLTVEQSVKRKLFSLPFWGWLIILLIPYLQVFCLLVACTKSDPANATVMVVPCFLCLRLASWNTHRQTPRQTILEVEAVETGKLMSNGHSNVSP
ncbi:putative transmembrane protein [Apostichopus japonicus]|uniref:Lysosomal enzyme trafficking factor n=2 Tax=Stichopus japonicus TaxID=307972 RepID=A0A2G8LR74_STIJA|nr:putative transmembrane protein [Apostichopus japonicus]